MKLGFDIDGVVADLPSMMLEYINEKFNLNHDINVFKNHDVSLNKYVDDDELSGEIATALLKDIVRNNEAVEKVKPYEDAVVAIRKLAKHHSIHYITVRPSDQRKATINWLRINSIPFNSIHVIGGNGPGGGLVGKGQTGRYLNLDFYLDDSPWHLDDMYRYKNRWHKGVALLTRPWNVDESLDRSKFMRFDNWNEIIRHLGIHKR
jgi:uncharacterized HAD superfamily protein